MACIVETTLALFLDRRLDDERGAGIETHIDSCPTCRQLLGELARGRSESAQLERLDRFVLLEPLGTGAMGRVYAAYDPVLDRKVALKVLHASATTEAGRHQLLREAQALAKVSSPNVVAV